MASAASGAGPAPPARIDRDTMAERVRPCTACHGREGRATAQGYFPRIAGKPEAYLFAQLQGFRDGRRPQVQMAALVAHLSDDYLREIAAYFAALDLPYAPPAPASAPAAVLARGRALAEVGDAARALPACARCHGAALTGVLPATPGLLGLPREYLVGELGAWRQGQRQAAAPDCMREVARRLDAADVEAVSAWLAAQPVPAPARAALSSTLAWPRPLDCGAAP